MRAKILSTLAILCTLCGCERAERPGAQASLVILRFQEAPGGMLSTQFGALPTPIPQGGVTTSLVLSRYDAATGEIGRANFGEVTLATDASTGLANDIVGKAIEPGRYVIVRFVQAGRWGACFARQSWQFDVAPGEVAYLGTLDAKFHARALTAAIHAAHKETLFGRGPGGELFITYDNVPPPKLRPAATARDLQKVEAFKAANFPAFSAAPGNAALTPAQFGTGGTLSTIGRRSCGNMGA